MRKSRLDAHCLHEEGTAGEASRPFAMVRLQQSTETLDADDLTLMAKGQQERSTSPSIVAIMAHLDSLDEWFAGWRSRDESQTHGHAPDDAGRLDESAAAGRDHVPQG